ncbi:MAG: hypothetical protein KatS3mg104_0816 [Phycisphaerae bacterium]|jgi:4-hydroxybenzoate polyprenyltransferase|nr:MAG: hypothetical protein KatS3mg104_0816 [Phycisphaerae bacterium]
MSKHIFGWPVVLNCLIRAGHIGVWAGMYVIGAYIFFWQIASSDKTPGHWPPMRMDLFMGLLATCIYAMDRVKWSDRWFDPSDRLARPDRYAFLHPNARWIRLGVVLVFGLCLLMVTEVSVWLGVLGVLAIIGGFLYAPGPKRLGWRIKDLLGVKNLCVAISMVSLVLLATLPVGPIGQAAPDQLSQTVHQRLWPLGIAAILLLIRVLSDALLCDIQDAPSDLRHGTLTLVHLLGPDHSLKLALGVKILLCGMILVWPITSTSVRIGWAVAGIAGTGWLFYRRDQELKDWVDIVFLLEAVLASGISLLIQNSHFIIDFF